MATADAPALAPGRRVGAAELLAFSTAVYEAVGMPPEDAELAADTLVQADLWGTSRMA